MNILVIGKSGFGKSNLGDIVRNTIFKLDSNSTIHSSDPDRSIKSLGQGSNIYNISVRQLKDEETLDSLTKEEFEKSDIVIYLTSKKFNEWFRTIYSK